MNIVLWTKRATHGKGARAFCSGQAQTSPVNVVVDLSKQENRRAALDTIARKLNIASLDGWYKINKRAFVAHGGGPLLSRYYKGSILRALKDAYPTHDWQGWRFRVAPRNFWASEENQRKYFEWLAKELNLTNMDGWYDVTTSQVIQNGGFSLLRRYYTMNLAKAIMKQYPEHGWEEWKFGRTTPGFWDNLANQKRFFQWFEAKNHIATLDDWYNFSASDVIAEGSWMRKRTTNDPLGAALRMTYPDHKWKTWKFKFVPDGYWRNIKNCREFLEGIAPDVGVKDIDDWYQVTIEDVSNAGGTTMIHSVYSGSLRNALESIFTEHKWDPTKFRNSTVGAKQKERGTMLDVGTLLGVTVLADWYNIVGEHARERGARGIIDKYGTMPLALKALFPEHYWEEWRFQSTSAQDDTET